MRRWLDRFWWGWGPTLLALATVGVLAIGLSGCQPKIIQRKIQLDETPALPLLHDS